MSDKFWAEDLKVLIQNVCIIPSKDMTLNEKLNCITRTCVIISIVLFLIGKNDENMKDWWLYFLLLSISIILVIKYFYYPNNMNNYKENFTIVPTYNSSDFHTTVVTPLFSEEWQIPPPAYDLYTNIAPPPYLGGDTFTAPLKPQSYPYGQYLTRTNTLPADEHAIHLMNGGSQPAREYQNNLFTRHQIAFRENMTRIYKKKLDRRFRQYNCSDTYSPYYSY